MNAANKVIVVGGGAAGFFAAVNCAIKNPNNKIVLIEKTNKLLSKVKVSGGGRCNVTNACFDVKELIKNYPRGQKQLLQAFHQFSANDTVEWFESRGVKLKTEADGRMFPQSDSSQSIIDCLMSEAQNNKVNIKLQCKINSITKKQKGFVLHLENEGEMECDKLIIASGGSSKIVDYKWLQDLGHTIIHPVPSLFTFNIPSHPITQLMGVSMPQVKVSIEGTKLSQQGPILITHWGFSGPAVLKLSAWGAKQLYDVNYKFGIRINWLPNYDFDTMLKEFYELKNFHATQSINTRPWQEIPKRLWEYFLAKAEMKTELRWADVSKKQFNRLLENLVNDTYQANGKTTFKEEFVTCGGVSLDDVDFKTMQSKKCENLFFAGEILDIDGITGGFNFQAAWTEAWIAAQNC